MAAYLAGGCGGRARIWVVSDMTNLTDRTPAGNDESVFDAVSRVVNLFGAANETVSFQIVIQAGSEGVAGLRISWTDLTAGDREISADNIKVFAMQPAPVRRYPAWYIRLAEQKPAPANYYDALVPIDADGAGQPFKLRPYQRMALWVDVYAPRTTYGGVYIGRLAVRAGGEDIWNARLSMKVHKFVLPDARPFPAVGGFGHDDLFAAMLTNPDGTPLAATLLDRKRPHIRQGLVLMRQLMQLAHEHRLDLFDKYIHPLLKRDQNGQIQLDWSDYDAVVIPYLSGTAFADGVGCPVWPLPLGPHWPKPASYGGATSHAYISTTAKIAARCRRHFESLKFAEKVFAWPYRGGVHPRAYDQHTELARVIRLADPNMPILSLLPPRPPALTGWAVSSDFAGMADIFAPPGEWFDPSATFAGETASQQHPLAGQWLAPGTPPAMPGLGLVASPADIRALAWFAMKYNCKGLMLPEVLNWTGGARGESANAATRLFYPGTVAGVDGVLPTVRLKRLRRGLQDAAYLSILQQRGKAKVAKAMIDTMAHYGGADAAGDHYLDIRLNGWPQDGQAWTLARKILAEEIEQAVLAKTPSGRRTLAQRLMWRTLDEKARAVRVGRIRSRVEPGPGQPLDDPKILAATVTVELHNEFDRNAEAVIEINALPAGWKAAAKELRVKLAAGEHKSAELNITGPASRALAAAKLPLGLTIEPTPGLSRRISAPVPLLRAGWAPRRVTVDGRLDDWPIRPGNTARNFKLLGRLGRVGDGLATRQTSVYVTYDRQNIYFAFRCYEPSYATMTFTNTNIVSYEQLLASGEDLIEIILDPGRKAGGPEDLYHIVIKPAGAVVTERGVSSQPPLGPVGHWAPAVQAAVAVHPGVWVVELAVPLASLAHAPTEGFWGVNFTRFTPTDSEASSWAGARRYYYNPADLGSMYFAPPKRPNGD